MNYWTCYHGIEALLRAIDGEDINEWVCVNLSSFEKDPIRCDYYVVLDPAEHAVDEEQFYIDEEGVEQWVGLKDKNLHKFLTVPDMQDVISYLHETGADSPSIHAAVKAIRYYYENDAFLDGSEL